MTIFKNFCVGAMIGAAALAASAAGAATTTFNLEGNNSTNYSGLPSAFSLTQGGITATFDGKAFSSVGISNNTLTNGVLVNGRIGRYSGGAGVTNATTDNSHTVDGSGYKDFIQIVLSVPMKIIGVSFGYTSSGDNFRWMWDSTGNGSIGSGDFVSNSIHVNSNNPFSGFGGITSSVFAVGAFGSYDSWKLKSVTFEYADTPPAPVPLPAAGFLLIGALGGLGLMKRRRKAA